MENISAMLLSIVTVIITARAPVASNPEIAWSRQPCAANVPGNAADIVTRWGKTVDPAIAAPLQECVLRAGLRNQRCIFAPAHFITCVDTVPRRVPRNRYMGHDIAYSQLYTNLL